MTDEVVRSQELIDSIETVEGRLKRRGHVWDAVRERFGPLIDEGYTEAEVLGAYMLGVDSIEAVRALLVGTPTEWAKAFESGEEHG